MADKIFDVNNSDEMLEAFERLTSALDKMDKSGDNLDKTLNNIYNSFKGINQEVSKYNKTPISQKFNKQSKEVQGSARAFSSSASRNASKMTRDLTSLFNSLGTGKTRAAVSGLSRGLSILGAESAAVAASVTLGAAALAAFGAAAGKAYQANLKLNNSLRTIGDTAGEMNSATSTSANNFIKAKNNLKTAFNELGSSLEGLVDIAAKAVDTLADGIKTVSGVEEEYKYNKSNSKVRWYTNTLSKYGVSEYNSVPQIASTAASAKQSGFSNTSAANLAIGTYDLAMKKALEYGRESQEVADSLAQAWLNGSDAAKEYGVVVDDQTLTGYMYSKGIDIANVKITDAMKQYYRYQLMQEELNSDSSDAMQDQIKSWKQLGMQIDLAKGKLFSFDEVINLVAVDTTIPEVGAPNIDYNEYGSLEEEDPAKNIAQTRENTAVTKENTATAQENTEVTKENTQAHKEVEEALAREGQQLGNVISQFQQGNIDISTFIDKLDSLVQSGNQWAQVMQNVTSAYATLIQATQNENTKMTAQLMYTQMLNLYMSTLGTNIEAVDEAMQALSETTAALSAVLVTDTQAARDAANAYNQLANALNKAAQGYRNKLAAMNATSTVSTATSNGSSSKVKTTLTNLGNTFSKLGNTKVGTTGKTVAKTAANSSVVNGLTFGASSGLVNGISNAKSNESLAGKVKSVVSGTIAGIANNVANKTTFGGASVSSNSSGKISANFNAGDISPLEIIDYLDAVRENDYDWGGTALAGLESSITGMYNTYKNQGGGLSGLTSAALWSLFESGADYATAAAYAANLFGWDSRTIDAYTGKVMAECYMQMLQAGISASNIERVMKVGYNPTTLQSVTQAVISAKNTETLEGIKNGSKVNNTLTQLGLATGGIGVKETTATLFENDKKEAVIPLETQAGIDFLANAMNQALSVSNNSQGGNSSTVNITFSDIVMMNDEQAMDKLADKLAPALERRNSRIGGLS